MKTIHKIFSFLFVLTLAWSCGEDSNLDPLGNWDLSEATLSAPSNNASITLDENAPTVKTKFEWLAAKATNRFVVQYKVVLVAAGSDDLASPLLEIIPGNSGKNLFAEATAEQIDYALWAACYPAGAAVNLEWAVISKAIEKETVVKQAISFTRFETEYFPETLFLTGSATEKGTDVSQAIQLRTRTNADGDPTFIFDVYTTLTEGGTYQFRDQTETPSRVYGGTDGILEGCGPAITAPKTGQYRITVDLNKNTYDTMSIDRWSLVGDAVEGGWGGDVPLIYQGGSIWSAKLEFYKPYETAGFIFRANGDWGYLLKRVVGTATSDDNGGDVIMESEAGDVGLSYEDVPGPEAGTYTVTLNLEDYTYQLVESGSAVPAKAILGESTNPDGDAVSGNFPFGQYDIPDQLFLISDGSVVAELTKDGTSFVSGKFLALEESKKYTLNSASDGSGTTYNDIGNGEISVARDQAYQLTVNFENGKLTWKYYNIKLFHWDEVGGGWDARQELLMTYSHPYTFSVTGSTLSAGFVSKFISPWDIQFGTDATALSGTMTNGGDNFTGIVQNGTYDATIIASDDYTTADYTFVKQ